MRRLPAIVFVAVCMGIGCGSIPDVVFVRSDTSDGAAPGDGGAEATAESGPIEAGPLMCGTKEIPAGSGLVCCGNVALCSGDACPGPGGASKCVDACVSCTEICCRKKTAGSNVNTTCAATAADCPP